MRPRFPSFGSSRCPRSSTNVVPALLQQQHIVGAALAVVHDGRVVALRGYGKPTVESPHDLDPSRTVFRIGSVTKIFTAAAALQLAERGLIDLDRDIREYLPDVPIRYPTTTRQLLTHTAGFDEKFAGGYTESAESLQPLAEHVRRYARQIKPPGGAYTYSNTNYLVAGLIVERRSGVSFEDYLARQVFEPLGMSATTAHQPRESHGGLEVARGYRWRDGKYEPLASRFTQSGPAGAVTAPASDMARMMAALLAEGALEGRRVLSPESARSLLSPQFVSHPRIGEAATYGFAVLSARGRRLVYRGGTLGDQASMVLLFPPERLGIFVASTSLPGLGDFLFDPLITHLVGPAVPMPHPAAPRNGAPHAAHVAGMYRDYHHTRHDLSRLRALMPMIQSPVSPAPDGSIRWQGRRWVEVEPLVFAAAESSGRPATHRVSGRRARPRARASCRRRHIRADRLAGAALVPPGPAGVVHRRFRVVCVMAPLARHPRPPITASRARRADMRSGRGGVERHLRGRPGVGHRRPRWHDATASRPASSCSACRSRAPLSP